MKSFSTTLAIAATFAGLLAACSHNQAGDGAPSPELAPLHARLAPAASDGFGHLRFELSRPAYVAVFEVVPGRGVSLLYPRDGDDPTKPTDGFSSAVYDVPGRTLYQGGGGALSATCSRGNGCTGAAGQGPYRLLIASEKPLDVAGFVQSPDSLRSALGVALFASPDAYRVMDRLMDLVVPNALSENDWITDVDLRSGSAFPRVASIQVPASSPRWPPAAAPASSSSVIATSAPTATPAAPVSAPKPAPAAASRPAPVTRAPNR